MMNIVQYGALTSMTCDQNHAIILQKLIDKKYQDYQTLPPAAGWRLKKIEIYRKEWHDEATRKLVEVPK